MSSLILRTSTPFLATTLFLVSIVMLLRGHNNPGGGFVGGLLAAGAFALWAIAFNVPLARRRLRIDPHMLVGVGLSLALGSGLVSLTRGIPFMTDQWIFLELPVIGHLDIGTPTVFDIGVYCVVLGVMTMVLLNLAEE